MKEAGYLLLMAVALLDRLDGMVDAVAYQNARIDQYLRICLLAIDHRFGRVQSVALNYTDDSIRMLAEIPIDESGHRKSQDC